MNKKFQKVTGAIITAAITGSIIVAPFTKVGALSLDEVYAQAYKSTINAITVKTQKSINEARGSIALLPKELHWAIGEFSKQVDLIQHPFFVKAYQAVLKAQTSPTQENINLAKASIDPDMHPFYRGSYSQAVDVVQQKLMKEAKDAVDKAIKSNLKSDIDKAYKLINEIKGALNTSIANWANLVEKQLTETVGIKIVSIKPMSDISVAYGTSLLDIRLPNKISLNLSDNTTKDVNVNWSCSEYDRYTSKTYTFVGSYDLPELVVGMKPEITVKVIVGPYYNPGSGGGGVKPEPSQPLKIIDESKSELKEGLLGTYYIAVRLNDGEDYSKYSAAIKETNTELKYDDIVQGFFYENAYGNIPNTVVVVVTEKSTGKIQEVTISLKAQETLDVVNSNETILVEPLVGIYALKVTLKEGYNYDKYKASIKGTNVELAYDEEVKAFFYDNYEGEVPNSSTIIITEKLTGRTQEIVVKLLEN